MKKLLVVLLVGALMLGWGFGARQVQAGGPPTVDFSAGVTADGCETETGDTVCDIDVGATFTVTVNINNFFNLPPFASGGYVALQAYLMNSAALTVQGAPNASWTWPDCMIPAEMVGTIEITAACDKFLNPVSHYTGPAVDILYQCSTIAGAHTITLMNGVPTDTFLVDESSNSVAEVGNESLTINCNAPPLPTPPPPPPVGGIVETLTGGDSPAEGSASSSSDYTLAIAAAAAGAVLALAVGGWYARRRLS
jgi:hypothetical protein